MNFGQIELKNVILSKNTGSSILNCNTGKFLVFENVNFMTGNNSKPFSIEKVRNVRKVDIKLNSSSIAVN